MWRIFVVVGVVWLALLPPLFTDGACTAQFDAEAAKLEADVARLRTSQLAVQYWNARTVPAAALSVEQCRQAKPRFLARCGSGPLVYARIPVENRICRLYRDSEIKVQLHYDQSDRLIRIATDMDPFKSLPVPFTGMTVHWAR